MTNTVAHSSKRKPIAILTEESKAKSFAINKARTDIDTIIKESGSYHVIQMGSTSRIGFFRVIKRYYDIYSLLLRLKHGDSVFFQFPWIHNNKDKFYSFLFKKETKVTCVIHDLDSLRSNGKNQEYEIDILKKCHHIIAHTPSMKQYLVDMGISSDKIECLYLFCYLTDDPIRSLPNNIYNTIIFAGNLTKSRFVNHLHEIASPQLSFNLYGNGSDLFRPSEYVKYRGAFQPNHPGIIEGNWGLVWDGDSIDTCSGLFGESLNYNSSHKFSLYLSLGIPVIIWEQSSLKSFIIEQKLGIAVKSLKEITSVIGSLSKAEITTIRNNVISFSANIRTGKSFKNIIENNCL